MNVLQCTGYATTVAALDKKSSPTSSCKSLLFSLLLFLLSLLSLLLFSLLLFFEYPRAVQGDDTSEGGEGERGEREGKGGEGRAREGTGAVASAIDSSVYRIHKRPIHLDSPASRLEHLPS